METNYYTELAGIDVSEHKEQKGQFSYLSWAWAVDQLLRYDSQANWETLRFDGMPYMKTELGYFVEVAVTVKGVTRGQIHPVLDNRNKPIAKPSPFDINTSIQRCLVKAIALHGLGLYIYAGEDLPPTGPITGQQVGKIKTKALECAQLFGRTDEEVMQKLEINDVTKLNEGQADDAIKLLDKWIANAKEQQAKEVEPNTEVSA